MPYPLPTILLLSDSTCQPLLCNGAQQEQPHTWRLSKANHRLGVVGHDCGKQTAMGFVGGCFCCLSALSARAQWGGYTEDSCYLEGQSDA